MGDYEDLSDGLRVDHSVCDGDEIEVGAMHVVAVALPGHTKCSFGFYAALTSVMSLTRY